jgi:predicted secreted protein
LVGTTVTASTGTWNVGNGDLAFSYQWTADGTAIAGAVGSSYTIPSADLGSALGVIVTAKLAGVSASASSSTKDVSATSKTTISLKKGTITTHTKGSVTVTVTSPGTSRPTGSVVLSYGKKSITKSLVSSSKGKLTFSLPKLKKGTYSVTATYKGSNDISASKSSAKKLIVKK